MTGIESGDWTIKWYRSFSPVGSYKKIMNLTMAWLSIAIRISNDYLGP
jgi:hypothetical protein